MTQNCHDASVQCDIEKIQFNHIKEKLQIPDLEPNKKLPLPGTPNSIIVPDFYSESAHIIGEIYSHLGKLKPAQLHKIAADVLKMLLYEKAANIQMNKIIVVCCKQTKEQLEGNSNLANALRIFGVPVEYIPLPQNLEHQLHDAMKRQNW
ncbi:MAG: hypothetical protein II723_00700 [Oscillospiraceae bacterium]|nr:hypothetical protein [Oscillospiraceae bacterium]